MSNTKGSMLISNANAVGTELVNQLGGTGYTPAEWADAINLLGISDDDKASALAGITEGTYTGTERGAIKYSNCNAVGAMLNKKFSTNRGFKPVEWESAISKLTPLAEGTVSGAICNIVNGAEDVPLKNWQVTLPASLDGYSAIGCTVSGKNLFDKTAITPNTWIVVNSTETESAVGYSTSDYIRVEQGKRYYVSLKSSNRSAYYDMNKNGIAYFSFNGNASFTALYDGYVRITINNNIDLNSFMFNEGSTAVSYEPYNGTTATASLGRTIYGGTADIITGEGEDENGNDFTFTPITPTPETALGVNNFWADNGDSTITYRKDPDIPDPPVQLLNMNNNENNNNEGV